MKKGSNTPQEIELKLELEPEALDQVLAHPLFEAQSCDNPVTQTLQSIYFDTPDQVLRQAGISLRIRHNGHQRIQTIKAARSPDGVALSRSEWEHEVAGDRPDYALAAETALNPLLKHQEAIRPAFSVTAERTLHILSYGKSTIEVAADRATVEAKERTLRFGELELELKKGHPADLFDLAQALTRQTPLRLSFTTKAERGYEVSSGKLPQRIKADPVLLRRRMTSAQAFQVIGASCLRHLMANEAIVRATPEGDAVHQMRVALRRLRAAITLFKAVVEDEQRDQVKAELKWMANLLGEARDLDVYITKVLEPAGDQHKDDQDFQQLLAGYQDRRNQAYQTVQETIVSSRFVSGVLNTAETWLSLIRKSATRCASRSKSCATLASSLTTYSKAVVRKSGSGQR